MLDLVMEKKLQRVTTPSGPFWQIGWKIAMSKTPSTKSTIQAVFTMSFQDGLRKEIKEAMQKAVEKEMATWMKFDAIEVIPPEEARLILEKEPEKVISSRGVWTKKETEEVNGKQPLELKCRIVGRGFQEMYDEKLRRDSPNMFTAIGEHHLLCGSQPWFETQCSRCSWSFSSRGWRSKETCTSSCQQTWDRQQFLMLLLVVCWSWRSQSTGVNDAARQW